MSFSGLQIVRIFQSIRKGSTSFVVMVEVEVVAFFRLEAFIVYQRFVVNPDLKISSDAPSLKYSKVPMLSHPDAELTEKIVSKFHKKKHQSYAFVCNCTAINVCYFINEFKSRKTQAVDEKSCA